MTTRIARTIILFITTLALISFSSVPLQADDEISLSTGQAVYVSVYSHIYSGVKARPFELGAILSIRNVDPKNSLIITTVMYYDSDGNPIKDFLDQPVRLNALASIRYIVPEGDKTGGSGANFIVRWKSEKKVNPPIIESIMIGTRSGQGISFVSRGQVIREE